MTFTKPRLVLLPPGTRSAQPPASAVAEGAIYFVTDELVLERSNGTTWDAYSATVEFAQLDDALLELLAYAFARLAVLEDAQGIVYGPRDVQPPAAWTLLKGLL